MQKLSPLAELIEAQRHKAELSPTPIQRMSGPVLALRAQFGQRATQSPLGHVVVIQVKAGKLSSFNGDGTPAPVSPGDFQRHIDRGGAVIAVDKPSLDHFLRRLERLGNPVSKRLAYQIRAAARLPISSQVGVLTEMCGRKFWAPSKMDVSDINAWRDVLKAQSGVRGILEMVDSTMFVDDPNRMGDTVKGAWSAMHESSTVVYEKSASGSNDSAVKAFLAAEKVTEAWQAIRAFDPTGYREVVADGTSAIVVPIERDTSSANVIATMTQPCRIKSGRTVHLLDAETALKVGEANLSRLSFDPAHGLLGEFSPVSVGGKSKTRSFTVMDSSIVTRRPLVAVTPPFFGSTRSGKSGGSSRWTFGKAPGAVAGRDVPMDVMLAGGVTD